MFPTYLGRQLPHFNCSELKLLGIIDLDSYPTAAVYSTACLPREAIKKSPTNFRDGAPENIKCWLMEHILYSINLQKLKYTIILHKLGSSQPRMLKWPSDSYMSMSRTAFAKLIALIFFFNSWLNAITRKENNHQFYQNILISYPFWLFKVRMALKWTGMNGFSKWSINA